jgi:hypothetical protein
MLVIALGPGPPAEHWLNADVHYRDFNLGLAVFIPLTSIYGALVGPAKITAACDEVASELNRPSSNPGVCCVGFLNMWIFTNCLKEGAGRCR